MRPRATSTVLRLVAWALLIGAFLVTAPPAESQEYSLFDKFSLGVGGSSISFDTKIRVDAEALEGTDIDFEETLGLGSSQFTPSVRFSWRAGRRHLITAVWDSTSRDATQAVSGELSFGDLVVPIDATVKSSLDIDELLFGYTYYPWLKDRWALGIGLGVRFLDLSAKIQITDFGPGPPLAIDSEKASASAPAPYINFNYRYGISEKWRLIADLGFLDIELDDFEGSQTVLGATFEHLAWQGFSWGFGGSYSAVDVVVTAPDLKGSLKFDIFRVGIFIKARW